MEIGTIVVVNKSTLERHDLSLSYRSELLESKCQGKVVADNVHVPFDFVGPLWLAVDFGNRKPSHCFPPSELTMVAVADSPSRENAKVEIAKTVTFPDGGIGEVVAEEHGSLIVKHDYLYHCVDVDEAGCVIPVEPDSDRAKILHLKHELWDLGDRFTGILDEITAAVGDKDWPYPQFVVLAVKQEMEDKKKLATENDKLKQDMRRIIAQTDPYKARDIAKAALGYDV